jgi:hypothetical protein
MQESIKAAERINQIQTEGFGRMGLNEVKLTYFRHKSDINAAGGGDGRL